MWFCGTDPPGETIYLTVGVNEYEGTEGDDTFIGEIGTFTNNTEIDGKEGTDTLQAEISADLNTGPSLNNVEIVELNNLSGLERKVNTENFDGVEQLWSVESFGSIRFDNIDSTDMQFGIKDSKKGIDLRFTADALGDATEEDTTVNVNLSDVEGGNLLVGPQSLLAAGGVNILNLMTAGEENELDLVRDSRISNQKLETVNIVGDADLKISEFNAPIETINAGALNANIDVNVGNLNDDLSIIGGKGEDNTVRGNVTEDVETAMTNVQNLDLTFTSGKTFDAGNTNAAAEYTLKGSGPSLANVVTGSTFTSNELTSVAVSEIGFMGYEDFDLTTTTKLTDTGLKNAQAVTFNGINFENVRDVTVTSDNEANTVLGAVALGELGRSVNLTANTKGDVTVGAVTVAAGNSLAQTLNLTSKAKDGDVTSDAYTAGGSLTANLIAEDEGKVTVGDALTSETGNVNVTATSNKKGGDVTVHSAVAHLGAVVTGTAARETDVKVANNAAGITAANGDITLNLTGKAGTSSAAGGNAVAGNDAIAAEGNVSATLTAEAYAIAKTAALTATKGTVTVVGNAAVGADATKGLVETGAIAGKNGVTLDLTNAAGSATTTATSKVDGTIEATHGDINMELDNKAYGKMEITGATTAGADEKANVTIELTAGRDSDTQLGAITADNKGDVTLDISAPATQGFTTLETGKITGGTVTLSSTANGTGNTVTINGIKATDETANATVITVEVAGTASVNLGALEANVATKTLVNAENLSGKLEVTLSKAKDTIVLGDGQDTVTFLAADNNENTILNFTAGAGEDVLDFTAFIDGTDGTKTDVATDADTVVANNLIYVTVIADNITGSDFGDADFADMFADNDGTPMSTTGATANANAVLLVKGDDITQVYFINNGDDTEIAVGEVTLVGTIDHTGDWDNANFAAA